MRHPEHPMTRPTSLSLAFLAVLPLAGCASPADSPECEVDLVARTLECVRSFDPNPSTVDDESRTTVRMTFAPGAADGATRSVQGAADHVLTELSFAGETFDPSRTSGLEGDHDPLVEDVLVWRRVHVLHLDEYARVDVVGEVAIDAAGHGHVHLEWGTPEPSSGRAGSGSSSMDATF